MALSPDYLQSVAAVMEAAASVREAAAHWRARDPAMRVVVVDAMDMRGETPALRLGSPITTNSTTPTASRIFWP